MLRVAPARAEGMLPAPGPSPVRLRTCALWIGPGSGRRHSRTSPAATCSGPGRDFLLEFSDRSLEASFEVRLALHHPLDTFAALEKLISFYVREHNEVVPRAALHGVTRDEVFFGSSRASLSVVPTGLLSPRAPSRRKGAHSAASAGIRKGIRSFLLARLEAGDGQLFVAETTDSEGREIAEELEAARRQAPAAQFEANRALSCERSRAGPAMEVTPDPQHSRSRKPRGFRCDANAPVECSMS